MKNLEKSTVIVAVIGIMWLLTGTSCEKEETTRSMGEDYESEKIDNASGITFRMESDSLKEEFENIRLEAEEWEEESLGVDLCGGV